ncbi:MAG: copper resistance protein NlpE [Prevotella sp.]|jgi:uncharacterized lipoprotein NlpE involved in copper resistance|nr:copper resistance protein NlpE [Prevotella sp.]
MKKLFITALAATALAACSNAPKSASDSVEATHTPDYYGVYTGTLPCADCEGTRVEVALNDSSRFTRKTVYLGKDTTVYEETGAYLWDGETRIITLEGVIGAPDKYLVGENELKQLDMEGKEITGELADKYILKK